MKVLYANPIFLDYRIPYYKSLIKLFNNEFYILYSPYRYRNRYDSLLDKISNDLGENAIEFNDEKVYNTSTHSFNRYSGDGKNIPFSYKIINKIRNIRPNVIITEGFFQWTPWIILYKILFGTKLFMGYERTCHTERNTNWLQLLDRKISNYFIDGYLVNGAETKKYLQSIGVSSSKIFIGGMNADSKGLLSSIKMFSQNDRKIFKNRFKRSENGLVFLFTGQIIKRKGIDLLLDAWRDHIKEFKDDSLVVVGKGNLLEELKQKFSEYESIYFEGGVEYDVIYKYYAIADVYIMPTIEDNWSLVIPEAMACGLPVATTIYNGCHVELIKSGVNGFVFDPYKRETIISTLKKFHYVDLKKFGQASIEIEKPFNTDNCAQRTYDAIINIVQGCKKV